MPPKRKRVEDGAGVEEATSSRATRSSARNKTVDAAPEPVKPRKKTTKATPANESSPEVTMEERAPKRKRATKAAAKTPTGEKTTKRGRNNAGLSEDLEPQAKPIARPPSIVSQPSQHSLSTTTSESRQPQPKKPSTAPAQPVNLFSKNEPYTPQRANSLFAQYADSDDPNVIGPEGFEQLFTDAEISMEGALPLILAWQMSAADMAKISKDEWTKGTSTLKISALDTLSIALNDLQNLLVLKQKPLQKPVKNGQEPYDRSTYYSYAANPQSAFQKFYSYCFALAKLEGSRNIDMETSAAFWTVLLAPQYPIIKEVVEFIGEKKDVYRATNKDLWSMMLEFCETVKPTLEDYESDGAWPTLLDDFVLWKKTNGGANPNGI